MQQSAAMIRRVAVLMFYLSILLKSVFANPPVGFGRTLRNIDDNAEKTFFQAIESGNFEAIRQLITPQNINAVDENKLTALHLAARNDTTATINEILSILVQGAEDLVKLLIENGADIEKGTKRGETALILAASKGQLEIVKLLIQKGALVNAADRNRDTPLIWASSNGHTDVVRLLIDSGASIDQVNKKLESPLMWAAIDGFEDILNLLIERGADIERRNKKNETALMWAAVSGYDAIAQILIDKGADVNSTNRAGDSALTLAAAVGEEVTVDLLIENMANINAINNENDTALLISIEKEFDTVAELLIEKGADVNIVGHRGKTALMCAAEKGYEIVVQALIEKRANVNAVDQNLLTPLMYGIGEENIIKLLIENAADINAKNADNNSALIIAVKSGSMKALEILIEHKADLSIVNKDGFSVLDYASNLTEGREEVIRLLTRRGAEHGGIVLYRDTAQKACKLYSNMTSRWSYGTGTRVFDGTLAETGEFPWMVALGYLSQQYRVSFSCGGSLISDLFVLTAAHCVKDNRRPVVARLGKVTLSDEDDFRAENQNIREIISHPKYSARTKKNDIALICLIDRLWITEYIHPICLQTNLRDEDRRTSLIVTGWGQIDAKSTSTALLKIELKTMPLSECNTTLVNFNEMRDVPAFRNGIDESQYCAHDPIGNQDSCRGDSGGPLQTMRSYSRLSKIVGIVSFGIGCGQGQPGIYTRVAHYIDWIGSHVWPKGEIQTLRVYAKDDDDADYKYIFSAK